MCNKDRKYNFTLNVYNKSINAPRKHTCNGFTATCIGDDPVKINGRQLFPSSAPATILGDSRSWGGNEGEIYTGNIEIIFAGIGVAPAVEIEQKFYLDDAF